MSVLLYVDHFFDNSLNSQRMTPLETLHAIDQVYALMNHYDLSISRNRIVTVQEAMHEENAHDRYDALDALEYWSYDDSPCMPYDSADPLEMLYQDRLAQIDAALEAERLVHRAQADQLWEEYYRREQWYRGISEAITLREIELYEGHVAEVDLALWFSLAEQLYCYE
jgi:hypothetical protein